MRCWIALFTSITTEPPPAGQGGPDGAVVIDLALAQQAVASLALGFTPRVAVEGEAVLLDVTGSLRLFGGLAALMAALQTRIDDFFRAQGVQAMTLKAQGATSLIALGRLRVQTASLDAAQDDEAAGQAASPSSRGRRGHLRQRVADLPMHTLSAARPHLAVLERIGCRTWDDLLRLPRDGVARRFSADLLAALDRARGQAADDYVWRVLPEHFEERLELHALVEDASALMAGVDGLLVHLQAWLLGRQSGLSALRLVWHLDKRKDVAPTGELDIRTAQPAQDLRHVARLISEHLAQQVLPAPVHSLTLMSLATEFLQDAAAATGSLLMEARQQGDGIVELVERLSARLGDAQVLAWQPLADYRPERMQQWVPARGVLPAIRSGLAEADGGRPRGRRRMAQAQAQDRPRVDALYPAWLLPEPLRLQRRGDSPVWQGRLALLAGPQRMEAGGWLADGESRADGDQVRGDPVAMRDYFVYRCEQGHLLWLYRERLSLQQMMQGHVPEWFLQGFFA